MKAFISTLTLLVLTVYYCYSQESSKFRTEVRGGDTIIVAELTIPEARALLQARAQASHQAELIAQKDSIISRQINHIKFLDSQISELDSTYQQYNKVLAFKAQQIDALEQTIDIQSLQLKKQSRRKFLYIGGGLVTGFAVGVVVGVLK